MKKLLIILFVVLFSINTNAQYSEKQHFSKFDIKMLAINIGGITALTMTNYIFPNNLKMRNVYLWTVMAATISLSITFTIKEKKRFKNRRL